MLFLSDNGQLSIPRNNLAGTETFSFTFKRYAGTELFFSGIVPFFVGINELKFNIPIVDFADGQYSMTVTTDGYSYSEDVLVELPQQGFIINPTEVLFNYLAPTFSSSDWILENGTWIGTGLWTADGIWKTT